MALGGSQGDLRAGQEIYRVFVSHSSRDSWIAGILAEKIAALGAEPWLDVQHKRVTPILNNVPYDAIVPLRGGKAIDLNDFERFLSELDKRVRQEEK